jgi:hypothetical protein
VADEDIRTLEREASPDDEARFRDLVCDRVSRIHNVLFQTLQVLRENGIVS